MNNSESDNFRSDNSDSEKLPDDPRKLRKLIKSRLENLSEDDRKLRKMIKTGNVDLVKDSLEPILGNHKASWDAEEYLGKLMSYTATIGYLEMIRMMCDLHKDHRRYNLISDPGIVIIYQMYVLGTAAANGHFHIVHFLLENTKQSNETKTMAILCATLGGHIDIVKFFLEDESFDDTYIENLMVTAAKAGHFEIVKLMMEKGAKDYNLAMKCAVDDINTEIDNIEYYIGIKIRHYMMNASIPHYGEYPDRKIRSETCIKIIKLLLEHGANNYDEVIEKIMKDNTLDNSSEIIELIDSHRAEVYFQEAHEHWVSVVKN